MLATRTAACPPVAYAATVMLLLGGHTAVAAGARPAAAKAPATSQEPTETPAAERTAPAATVPADKKAESPSTPAPADPKPAASEAAPTDTEDDAILKDVDFLRLFDLWLSFDLFADDPD